MSKDFFVWSEEGSTVKVKLLQKIDDHWPKARGQL